MTHSLLRIDYGTQSIECLLERRHRSTLEITVLPDGHVRVLAPVEAAIEQISQRVRKRGRWIRKQQNFFEQFTPRTPERTYFPGETHLYLGRQHRLRVVPGDKQQVKMIRGYIQVEGVDSSDREVIKHLVTGWYRARATRQFQQRLELNQARFPDPCSVVPTAVRLHAMESRWGSMSSSGRLLLNPELVKAPPDAIDYVITHELCHILVPNHSPAFYRLQDQVLPDWQRRKDRLERIMA